MAIAENAIFKFVSLHRPNNGLIIDPTYDVPDNDVEERLQDLDVSPANASDDVIDLLDEDAILTKRELDSLMLSVINEGLVKYRSSAHDHRHCSSLREYCFYQILGNSY